MKQRQSPDKKSFYLRLIRRHAHTPHSPAVADTTSTMEICGLSVLASVFDEERGGYKTESRESGLQFMAVLQIKMSPCVLIESLVGALFKLSFT